MDAVAAADARPGSARGARPSKPATSEDAHIHEHSGSRRTLIHARTVRAHIDPDIRTLEPPGCRKCRREEGHLARYLQARGATGLRWVCDHCGDYGTFSDLPRSLLRELDLVLDHLPVCCDNRSAPDFSRGCCICGRHPSEENHWAPVAIFPDWEERARNVGDFSLITVPLSIACHREWHDRLRDHGLLWPHEIEAA